MTIEGVELKLSGLYNALALMCNLCPPNIKSPMRRKTTLCHKAVHFDSIIRGESRLETDWTWPWDQQPKVSTRVEHLTNKTSACFPAKPSIDSEF